MNDVSLTFAHTWLIPAGVAACALLYWLLRLLRARNRSLLTRFAGDTLLPRLIEGVSPARRSLKTLLMMAGILAVFAALARPQKGYEWQEVSRKGIDIAIAIDTSKSMLAADIVPNRLDRAKLAVADFVQKAKGDRIALIPFAGTAFVLCPPTLDYDALLQSLQMLDTDIMPRPGTNLAAAIATGVETLSHTANQKVLIILSDGEELEGSALKAAKEAATAGLKIYTVGVGSPAGELLMIRTKNGNTSFLKDSSGNPVKSRLDEESLRQIAEESGGAYYPLGTKGDGLDSIYVNHLQLIPKSELSQRMKRLPVERFEWCLLAAIIFLMLEFGIKERPSALKSKPGISAAILLALLTAFSTPRAEASPRAAEKAYNEGKFEDAVRELEPEARESSDPVLRFNLGAAQYKSGQYEKSIEEFQKSISAKDLGLQAKSYYNLGNAWYRKGDGTDKKNQEGKLKAWQQAIANYENALKLEPSDRNAKDNRDFVRKRVQELMQNSPQTGEQKDNQSSAEEDKNKQDQGKPHESQQQEQQQQQNSQETKQDSRQDTGEKPASDSKDEKQQGSQSTPAAELPDNMSSAGATPAPAPSRAPASKPGRRRMEMSQEEASQLLDSLRGDEKQVLPPLGPTAHADEDEPAKFW